MESDLFGFILSGILAVFYLMLAYLASQRGAGFGRTTQIMVFYSIVASIWELGAAYFGYGGMEIGFPLLDAWIHPIGILLLNVLLLAATIEFLNLDQRNVIFVGLGAVLGLAITLIVVGVVPLAEHLLPTVFWVIFLASELMLILSLWYTVRAFSRATRPAVHRRVQFWLLALLLLISADLIIFISSDLAGDLLRFAGLLIGGFFVFIHKRADVGWTLRRIISFWLNNALVFLTLVLFGRFRAPVQPGPEIWNSIDLYLDAFFAFYLFPSVMMIASLFNRSLLGLGFDHGARVRSFASKISSSLSLPLLAEVVVTELNGIFVLDYSDLIVADRQENDRVYQLRIVKPISKETTTEPSATGIFSFDNPLVKFFIDKKTPIESSEIAWLKMKSDIPEAQWAWLGNMPYELFVPIVLHDSLVGILALGPKQSLERFYPVNFALAKMMADQMAAVLVNARLLDNTLRLNLELKSAQEEILNTNKKLRELDEMKSAFIGVITHELRTPLANIQFSSQVLEMYLKKVMTTEQRQQFNELNSATKTARTLIDNLVNFAAFLNEQVSLNVVEFDFSFLLREILVPLKPMMDIKNLRLQVNMIGDRFVVKGDPKLLKEAVIQLATNAIKFTNTGSVNVVCWTTKDALCFDVEDTGIGIEDGQLDQVWDAFTQIQSDSVKRGVEGLGLGLSLVKYIVKAHGGHVWVESSVGLGSTFGFQVPIAGPDHALPILAQRPKRLRMPQS